MTPATNSSATATMDSVASHEVNGVRPLLTKADAAQILGVHIRTIENLLVRKLLRRAKVGNRVRIDPADLRVYIESVKGR